ncbi:MAG TPA: GNAT family N-acetyltransferase [Patescibacteria group bacterium]|nr:GNAT family N-acetyltransferase [Patescibacteria group bacterium]
MRVEAANEVTEELHDAMARLLPQLNATLPVPSIERLEPVLADPAATLRVARERDQIVGTATVLCFATPFWLKARLDEVVVDASARGRGVGEALVAACIEVARQKGAEIVELQSGRGPQREAAHRLYRRMGFEPRDSTVFRLKL